MKRFPFFNTVWLTAATGMFLVMTGCSVNKLPEYDFRDKKMAVMAAIPPQPRVYSDFWYDAHPYGNRRQHPLVTVLRVGTAIAKYVQMDKAEARLDSALNRVDVPEIIARRTLLDAADHIGYAPVKSLRDADFILDLRVKNYGIVADSWSAATSLIIQGDVAIVDNATHKTIWRENLNVRERVSPRLFGLGGAAGNVFTATDLARLSSREMEEGFRNLALFAAERITNEFQHDYFHKR